MDVFYINPSATGASAATSTSIIQNNHKANQSISEKKPLLDKDDLADQVTSKSRMDALSRESPFGN